MNRHECSSLRLCRTFKVVSGKALSDNPSTLNEGTGDMPQLNGDEDLRMFLLNVILDLHDILSQRTWV